MQALHIMRDEFFFGRAFCCQETPPKIRNNSSVIKLFKHHCEQMMFVYQPLACSFSYPQEIVFSGDKHSTPPFRPRGFSERSYQRTGLAMNKPSAPLFWIGIHYYLPGENLLCNIRLENRAQCFSLLDSGSHSMLSNMRIIQSLAGQRYNSLHCY